MIKVGLTHTMKITVENDMTAKTMKSGALDVFATPVMVAYMENVCLDCTAPYLEEGMSTVGTGLNIKHLAPTPVKMEVTFSCTLVEIDRRRLVFEVQAKDEIEVIGQGTHERFIVDAKKFTEKCRNKSTTYNGRTQATF